MLKLLAKKISDFIFNERVIYIFLLFFDKCIKDKFRIAMGKVSLSKIKHKGKNCRFNGEVNVYYNDGLVLGDGVRIGFGTFIFALGGVEVGNNTQISRNVTIYSANHDTEGSHIPYDDKYVKRKVTIGNSVWIGMNAMILPGISIGDGAIIGMGCVVSKNVGEGEVVVGQPQRVVKIRNIEEFRNKLRNNKLFSTEWPES